MRIVGLRYTGSPTSEGCGNVAPRPTQSLDVVLQSRRVGIKQKKSPTPARTPWHQMLVEKGNEVLLRVGTAATRYHGDGEGQTLSEHVLLQALFRVAPADPYQLLEALFRVTPVTPLGTG